MYRIPGAFSPCALEDGRNLVGTVRATSGSQSFVDNSARGGTYVVTALDRAQNESGASAPRAVG